MMNTARVLIRQLQSLLILAFFSVSAFGWGQDGHKIINQSFTIHYPIDSLWFSRFTQYYAAHASDADNRKSADPSESPRHFIDIDYYPEFHSTWFPHDLDSLIAKYGSATVNLHGVLPWAIKSDYDSLVTFLRKGDTTNANRVIADLGHYIGDACQPLHCTENYDRNGVHSRYESTMLHDNLSQISITPDTAQYIPNVLDFAFDVIYNSNSKFQMIFNADDSAKSVAGNTTSSVYYQLMWSQLGSMTIGQLQKASVSLASLVYSAWVDAGFPPITTSVVETVPSDFSVSGFYPNPFNPSTKVDIDIPAAGHLTTVQVSVFALDGRKVRSLTAPLAPGRNTLTLDFGNLASGVYLTRIVVLNGNDSHPKILKALLMK